MLPKYSWMAISFHYRMIGLPGTTHLEADSCKQLNSIVLFFCFVLFFRPLYTVSKINLGLCSVFFLTVPQTDQFLSIHKNNLGVPSLAIKPHSSFVFPQKFSSPNLSLGATMLASHNVMQWVVLHQFK